MLFYIVNFFFIVDVKILHFYTKKTLKMKFLFIFLTICFSDVVVSQFNYHRRINNSPSYLFGESCGRRRAFTTQFVSNGQEVGLGEQPWMVRLTLLLPINNENLTCGGFIVNENWILTAGHCKVNGLVAVYVSVGRVDYRETGDRTYEQNMFVPAVQFHQHPNFRDGRINQFNDIALIRLPVSLKFDDYVQPICLLEEDSCENPSDYTNRVDYCPSEVISSGWGANRTVGGDVSKVLKTVNLRITPKNQCQTHYEGQLEMQQVCTTGSNGADTCPGDSGGPLICRHGDKNVAIAIVSHGLECGGSAPGVFTRICPYMDWIKSMLNEEQPPSNSQSPWIPNQCLIPSVRNGVILMNGRTAQSNSRVERDSVVNLFCDPGYSASETSFVCTVNGDWTPQIANCQPQITTDRPSVATNCQLPIENNGYYQPWGISIAYGTSVTLQCFQGYYAPITRFYCQENGLWNYQIQQCQRQTTTTPTTTTTTTTTSWYGCLQLPTIPNARIQPVTSAFALASCNPGFVASGGILLICKNRVWTHNVTCIREIG